MKRLIPAAALAILSNLAFAQASLPDERREPLSPVLLDHFYKQIYQWDKGAPGGLYAASSAMADIDFQTKTRPQLQQAGTAAFPIAPKVAELMLTSEKNRYSMAYMIMGMTPSPTEHEMKAVLRAASTAGAEQLVAFAQLGRSTSRDGLDALRGAAAAGEISARLMAAVALGYMGKAFPEEAPRAIAVNLKDKDKGVRTAAANGLRLIGAPSHVVAPELLEYLRTRDNPYLATAALKNLPASLLRPAKADLEAIVGNAKLNSLQKQDAVEILMRLETTR